MRGGTRQGLHGGQSARRGTAERDFPQRRRSFPGYSLVQCPSLERYLLIHEHVAARRHGKKKKNHIYGCIYGTFKLDLAIPSILHYLSDSCDKKNHIYVCIR